MPRKIILTIMVLLLAAVFSFSSYAADEDLWTIRTAPDALIVLDLSGSMDSPPQDDAANYFVTGASCSSSSDGPYYMASGTGHTRACLATSPTLYVSGTTCNITGPFYAASTSTHNWACTSGSKDTTHYGSSVPKYSDSTCGEPFYSSSGTGHTTSCSNTYSSNPSPTPQWSASDCTEPFYKTSGTGHTVRCRKVDIAKYALFSILNDSNTDGLNQINAADMASLGVRLGLMRFTGCSSNGSNSSSVQYTSSSSCIKLAWPLTSDAYTTTTPYASIYCNNNSCSTPATDGSNTCGTLESTSSTSPTHECIVGFGNGSYTPLQYALREAKRYMDNHKAVDPSASCRTKSVIFITDGADTISCSANGSTGTSQRRAPVYQAKQLKDAGYDVYVIGFGGNMPVDLQNTLNWAAYYGGTRNPNATQAGTTTAVSVGSNPCSNGTDPGPNYLAGYAFMATNPAELSTAIRSVISLIFAGTYSFSSQAAVAAARVQEENFLYEASFEPRNTTGANNEPFWPGHLNKYSINVSTGGLITPPCWDAGTKLAAQSSRNMWTYKGASGNTLSSYTTATIFDADLNVSPLSTSSCGTRCTQVVGFYRGESAYNIENVKLGDAFHTNPVIVKTPTANFYDPRECDAAGYETFRTDSANQRTASNGKQLVLIGANDGQLHAFRSGNSSTDCTAGGDEVWSFIPPNLLEKMAPIAHNSHADRASLATHQFFIDGPLQVTDVWIPSSAGVGTTKSSSDWKTVTIFGLGQGGGNFLWSACSSCYCPYDPGAPTATRYSATYSTTTPYYCGYYALDVTNSVAYSRPALLGRLNPTAAQAVYLGDPWSKPQIGRVKIAGNERWVAFIGAGYSPSACKSVDGATSYACNTTATYSAGKGFSVVDLTTGNIIWQFTHANNSNMDFSAPAAPIIIDKDSDGFIDTAYMGDLGGNMWRFRFCPSTNESCGQASYDTACTTANWTGSRLYAASDVERGSGLGTASNTHKQIYTKPTATKDPDGHIWVYWGTGENNDATWKPSASDPDTSSTKNRLYAVKDTDFTSTYTTADLKNVTSSLYCYSASTTGCTTPDTQQGWYINLSTNTLTLSDGTTYSSPKGEKMISDPIVYAGKVFLPTYLPNQGTATACGQAGNGFLYVLDYLTGAQTVVYVGIGIPSSVLISGKGKLYMTASGGSGISSLTTQPTTPPTTSSPVNVLYWLDKRLK